MIGNTIRDAASAWVTGGVDFAPILATVRGAVKAWREDPAMIAAMAAGGGLGGHYHPHGPGAAAALKGEKRVIVDNAKTLWRLWQKVGAASEASNRMAIYEAAKKKGASDAEAAYQAMDLMDFSMRGDWAATRFLIGTVPFLNARVQGLSRLARGAMDTPKGFLIKGGALAAPAP